MAVARHRMICLVLDCGYLYILPCSFPFFAAAISSFSSYLFILKTREPVCIHTDTVYLPHFFVICINNQENNSLHDGSIRNYSQGMQRYNAEEK